MVLVWAWEVNWMASNNRATAQSPTVPRAALSEKRRGPLPHGRLRPGTQHLQRGAGPDAWRHEVLAGAGRRLAPGPPGLLLARRPRRLCSGPDRGADAQADRHRPPEVPRRAGASGARDGLPLNSIFWHEY